MFDASKPFVVPILSGGEKSCEVRFPRTRNGALGRALSERAAFSRAREVAERRRGPAEDQRRTFRQDPHRQGWSCLR